MSNRLTLIVNGQTRQFVADARPGNVADLVALLGLKDDRVAVEWNGSIVGRDIWGRTALNDGDRLEVVHFVGGGLEHV